MNATIQKLKDVPGVMGCLLADKNGNLLANVFPSIFDTAVLRENVGLLIDSTSGLKEMTGGVQLFDLRFELGRVIIKPLANYFLVILCQPSINIPFLMISLNVAVKGLDNLPPEQISAPPVEPVQPLPPAAPVTIDPTDFATFSKFMKNIDIPME